MRVVVSLIFWAGLSFAQDAGVDDVLVRARAAREAAAQRGPLLVPGGDVQCFAPKGLTGEQCAQGFRLCRTVQYRGSCDGYSYEDVTLRPEYRGEPATRGAFPYFHEEGPDVSMLIEMECSTIGGIGYATAGAPINETPEGAKRREAENERRQAEARKSVDREQRRCEAQTRAKFAKDRRWQRCQLLSVDACAREAFLSCKGTQRPGGLLRVTWPLKIDVLEP